MRNNVIAIAAAAGLLAAGAVAWLGTDQDKQANPEVVAQLPDRAVRAPALAAEGSAVPASGMQLRAVELPKMGKAVTDANGAILYRFDKDTAKPPKSNCENDCAQKWPPVLTEGAPSIEGADNKLVGTVARADGSKQVTLAGWPLYRYAGDAKPGQWKGQGVGGTWFVVAPDGTKNLSCLPTTTAAAAPTTTAASGGY